MVATDLERYLGTSSYGNLTDDEKEDLFPKLITFELSSDVEQQDMVQLFKVTQEILKFKGEQVESLIAELDTLAAKQGEDEARTLRGTMDDAKHLDNNTDVRREILRLEIQINQLNTELGEKEEELLQEKKESEKLLKQTTVLENENKTLKGELTALQQESSSMQSDSKSQLESEQVTLEKYHELTEMLRQKNKHISQLLGDLEELETENGDLKEKLSLVSEEMSEGTKQMSKLSSERISLTISLEECKEKVARLEGENAGLRNEIKELAKEKELLDKKIENFSTTLDSRLQLWKDLLMKKDNELSSLRLQLNKQPESITSDVLSNSISIYQYQELKEILSKREEQIEELKIQLKQATIDLNENAILLEQQSRLGYRYSESDTNSMKQLSKKLDQADDRIAILEAKILSAEEDALKKAEEVTELIIQLREYESGTYGLEDATTRLKELQKQKEIRDEHIKQLVQATNKLQDEAYQLEKENLLFRQKLGIPVEEEINVDGISPRYKQLQSQLTETTQLLEKSSDEIITLKLEIRQLKKQIIVLKEERKTYEPKNGIEVIKTENRIEIDDVDKASTMMDENAYLNEKLKEIIDENEGLRKGMHEILQSIRSHDGSAIVRIESRTLEELLEALDSRHVSGWYQPGMRLQAHIQLLNGVNSALRDELYLYRHREDLVIEAEDADTVPPNTDGDLSEDGAIGHTEIWNQSEEKSDDQFAENALIAPEIIFEKDRKIQELEEEVTVFNDKLLDIEQQMKEINIRYDEDKESWYNVRTAMEKEISDLQNKQTDMAMKITEYEKHLEIVKNGPESIENSLASYVIELGAVKTEKEQLNRKCKLLENNQNLEKLENNKLSDELFSERQKCNRLISQVNKNRENSNSKILNLQNLLEKSIQQDLYYAVVDELNELTVKYRNELHKQILFQADCEKMISEIQKELTQVYGEKNEIQVKMIEFIGKYENLNFESELDKKEDTTGELLKKINLLEMEIFTNKENISHVEKMYKLSKEQLEETQNRSQTLQQQITTLIDANLQAQKTENDLHRRILNYPDKNEYERLITNLRDKEEQLEQLSKKNSELQEIADIAEEQIKALEENRMFKDLEFDVLQRKVMELQSVSDDKMVIERLTNELSSLQTSEVSSRLKISNLQDKIVSLESNLAKSDTKYENLLNELNELKSSYSKKKGYFISYITELQRRYLGSLPLAIEEIWSNNTSRLKTEYQILLTEMIHLNKTCDFGEINTQSESPVQLKIQELNLRMKIEDTENKCKIYEERLERQEKLISRLEEEMIHADQQCQDFLLHWNPMGKASNDLDNIILEQRNLENPMKENKTTQTAIIEEPKMEEEAEDKILRDIREKLKQATNKINQDQYKLEIAEKELEKLQNKLETIKEELNEKENIIKIKNKELTELKKSTTITLEKSSDCLNNNNEPQKDSVEIQALKATVNTLKNIIDQKEETIKRYQNLLQQCREDHAHNTESLHKKLNNLQRLMDVKEETCIRLRSKLEIREKIDVEEKNYISSFVTKIHELEDEISQAHDHIEYLKSQLKFPNKQEEEKRITVNPPPSQPQLSKKTEDTQIVTVDPELLVKIEEKEREISRLNETIEQMKKNSTDRISYRERIRNELERTKKKLQVMERKEKEDKAEIQRLKNQITSRPSSVLRKDILLTPKEEQLTKKVNELEKQLEEFKLKEQIWKNTKKAKCDEEVDKWQTKKRFQQTIEKLRNQYKEANNQIETLKMTIDRLRDTILRLEREKITLEAKLKTNKSQNTSTNLVEELQKSNNKLEEEIRILRKSYKLSAGSTSLTDVIEAQERKINILKLAQNGEGALAEQLERLQERKSQLQKINLRLENENMHLKLQLDKLSKFPCNNELDVVNSDENQTFGLNKSNQEKNLKRRNIDLERAMVVLKRVVEKLQEENKTLHNEKISKLQNEKNTEKLQIELQKQQENYLEAIEKYSNMEKQLQDNKSKISYLQQLISKYESGEEISNLRTKLTQKSELLSKVKVLLEKAVIRERELSVKVSMLENASLSTG